MAYLKMQLLSNIKLNLTDTCIGPKLQSDRVDYYATELILIPR